MGRQESTLPPHTQWNMDNSASTAETGTVAFRPALPHMAYRLELQAGATTWRPGAWMSVDEVDIRGPLPSCGMKTR